MIFGGVILVIGGMVYIAGKVGIPLGRLPGDIRIERENFTCFFPLTTMIIVSVILSIGFNLITKWLNK
jgi:hypothetical protein